MAEDRPPHIQALMNRALLKAIQQSDIVECRRLIDSESADVNSKDNSYNGWNTMIWASEGGSCAIIQLLIEKGVSVDCKDSTGSYPLFVAAWSGRLEAVELFLSYGCNPNLKTRKGTNSVIVATCYNHQDIVCLLISKGGNLRDEANCGGSCFSFARHRSLSPNRKGSILYHLRKWPTTMAIIVLTEISLIYQIDCSSLIDLHQYIGREDFTRDNEEDYTL
jgi:ankyrin repeat protein